MQIGSLKIESGNNGKTIVEIRASCISTRDVDDIIAWLELAKVVMVEWEKIYAQTSLAAKTAASKDEVAKPGQVQGEPQKA